MQTGKDLALHVPLILVSQARRWKQIWVEGTMKLTTTIRFFRLHLPFCCSLLSVLLLLGEHMNVCMFGVVVLVSKLLSVGLVGMGWAWWSQDEDEDKNVSWFRMNSSSGCNKALHGSRRHRACSEWRQCFIPWVLWRVPERWLKRPVVEWVQNSADAQLDSRILFSEMIPMIFCHFLPVSVRTTSVAWATEYCRSLRHTFEPLPVLLL